MAGVRCPIPNLQCSCTLVGEVVYKHVVLLMRSELYARGELPPAGGGSLPSVSLGSGHHTITGSGLPLPTLGS